jgi:hypothetical protein
VRTTLVLVSALTLAVGALAAPEAGAAEDLQPVVSSPADPTTLGQSGGIIGPCTGSAPAATMLGVEGVGAATYTAAGSGVLTSFTTLANGKAGQVRAIVFGASPAPGHRLVVAASPKQTVKTSALNTFSIRVPIKAGQQLGLGYTVSDMACIRVGVPGDTAWLAPVDPDTGSDFASTSPSPGNRPNISAVLEPDADNDGYGDLSQDACPRSASTQAVCPVPDTTITKKREPRATSTKARVKVTFASSIAGSTFQCRLDGHRKWRSCTSPFRRRLGIGVHRLKVRAVSPVGIPDPHPAKVRIRISRS